MTDLTQKPALINIVAAIDDSFSSVTTIAKNISSGYTVTAKVVHNGKTTSFTVGSITWNGSVSSVTISLTAAQLSAIDVGIHSWYQRYTNADGTDARRYFAGSFEVVDSPSS